LLFKTQRFANHWFETGAPIFLINLIHQGNYDIAEFDELRVSELAFSTYDLQRLAIVPLLAQTGYLTIKGYEKETQFFTLSYPNYEVQNAFLVYLLDAFSYTEQGLSESYIRSCPVKGMSFFKRRCFIICSISAYSTTTADRDKKRRIQWLN
jgi:hypothetical protein